MLARMPRLPFSPRSSSVRPVSAATQRTSDSEQWVLRLSTTKCQRVAVGSVAIVCWRCARKSASVRVEPQEGGDDLAGDHIPVEHERAGAMPDVLELPALDLAGDRWQAGMLAFQRLHA